MEDSVSLPRFEDLPKTTFFNLEAIAVDVWPKAGRTRRVYSGDDRFFRGVLDRTLELNRRDNPFPELCVVRALVLASSLDYELGPKLAQFVADIGLGLESSALEQIQRDHYGELRLAGATLRQYIEHIIDAVDCCPEHNLQLPLERQAVLWPEERGRPSRIRLLGAQV